MGYASRAEMGLQNSYRTLTTLGGWGFVVFYTSGTHYCGWGLGKQIPVHPTLSLSLCRGEVSQKMKKKKNMIIIYQECLDTFNLPSAIHRHLSQVCKQNRVIEKSHRIFDHMIPKTNVFRPFISEDCA